jgi:N-acyl-D-amino-acid deacylase
MKTLGGVYATHMRDEAAGVLASLDETFRIGQALGVRVVISHHKVMGTPNHGRSRETLPVIRAAMERQKVALDAYPYVAGSTVLRKEIVDVASRTLVASSRAHPEYSGADLADVAARMGVSIADAVAALQPASGIYFLMNEDDVQAILRFEETMIGSDGLPHDERPHPRLWGTFPKVLGHYSRDLGLFPLETAVWKMSGLTAETFGLRGRGMLTQGAHADIVLFDANHIADRATFEDPKRPAVGIDRVYVNGRLAWREGRGTGVLSGQVLRRAVPA